MHAPIFCVLMLRVYLYCNLDLPVTKAKSVQNVSETVKNESSHLFTVEASWEKNYIYWYNNADILEFLEKLDCFSF